MSAAQRFRGYPALGAIIAEAHQIGLQLLDRPFLLTRYGGLCAQPGRQLVGKGIEFDRLLGHLERGVNRITAQILAHRVPGQSGTSGDLPDRKLIMKMPASDNAQQRHVYHSLFPRRNHAGLGLNMDQFSVKKFGLTGSVLSEHQQTG